MGGWERRNWRMTRVEPSRTPGDAVKTPQACSTEHNVPVELSAETNISRLPRRAAPSNPPARSQFLKSAHKVELC